MELAELHHCIERLATHDVDHCDDLAGFVLGLERLRNVVHARAGEALVRFDDERSWVADGATDGASWVAARTGGSGRELRARVKTALRLQQLPAACSAAAAGELQPRHQQQLAECYRAFPGLAVEHDELLTSMALDRSLDMKGFDEAIKAWRSYAADVREIDADELERAAAAAQPSQVTLTEGFAGRWTLQGDLQPEVGAMLNGLLQQGFERLSRARRDGDPSLEGFDASMLRGEAFADLVANALRREPGEQSAPDRYRVAVVLTPEQFANPPVEACDSLLFRMVIEQKNAVVDLGRESRYWGKYLRRKMSFRDGGCIFPGCDRPPSWCDIHHCRHWHDGGETNEQNGALLCKRHHTFLHRTNWYVKFIDNRPVVYTNAGEEYRPHRWQTTASSRAGP